MNFLLEYVVFLANMCFFVLGAGVGGGNRRKCQDPQQTIQSPDRLNKAPEILYKAPTDNTKTQHIRQNLKKNMQNPKVLDKNQQY